MVQVKVSYKKQTKVFTLYVIENLSPSLLGCEWLSKLKLNALELGIASVKTEVEEAD